MERVNKNYRVSRDFDMRLMQIQVHLKYALGIDYTIGEILDEMMDLYEARYRLNSNIVIEMFREYNEALLQQYTITTAEMLNAIKEKLEEEATR